MDVNARNSNYIMELYDEREELPLSMFPFVSSSEHTKGTLLDEYIKDKVSSTILDEIIKNQTKLEIHGIYDGHIKIIRKKLGWDKIEDMGPIKQEIEKPLGFKSRYPRFYKVSKNSEEFFILSVFPGKEYIIHIVSLIKNYIERNKSGLSDKILRVFRYPVAEQKVYSWSGIEDSKIIRKGDVILIGYNIIDFLLNYGLELYAIYSKYPELFRWIIMKNRRNHRILFFGFTYFYWGSIIGKICEGFLKDGADLIIHIANLGSCREPEDAEGEEVFIPMFFTKIEGASVIFAKNPWNPLLELYENYNSGIHTCVNSVLEEVYEPFRKIVTRMGITSVDCEAFHIVHAVEESKKTKVGFSGIYYASDYVRKKKEKELKLPYDIINKDQQRIRRQRILPILAELLAKYLQNLATTPKI
jgi:hypothetical protein